MQVKDKIFCHWDLVRFVSEKHLKKDDGTFLTLSVTDGGKLEFMIFLGKDDSNSGYEVRVYKSEASDKYIPNENDNVNRYEENDEYATFGFDKYSAARKFVELLGCMHPEYKKRPVKEISMEKDSMENKLFVQRLTDEQIREFIERYFPRKDRYSYTVDKSKYLYVTVDYNNDYDFIFRLYDYDSEGFSKPGEWIKYLYEVFGEEYKKAYLAECEEVFN